MAFLHRLNPFSATHGKGQPRQSSSEEQQGLTRPSTSLSVDCSGEQRGASTEDTSTTRHTTRSRTPSKLRSVLSHHTFQPALPSSSPSPALETSSPSLFQRSLSKRNKLKSSTSAPFLTERPSTPSPRRLSRKRSTKTPTKDQIGTPQAPGAYAFKTWHSNAHLRTPGRPDSPSIVLDLSLDLEVEEDLMTIQTQGRWKRTARRLGLSTPERAALLADQPAPPVPTLPEAFQVVQHPHPPPLPAKDLEDETPEPIIPLAYLEHVPTGTPGGRRKDLAKGVLRDDVKSSSDQVRFFSRDMYSSGRMTSLSPSPSPSPTPSPRPAVVDKSTQRVSVDACGTPIKLQLPPSPQRHFEKDEDDDDSLQIGTALDTIDESPLNSASPSTPRQPHASAPPLSSTFSTSLLQAHAEHANELQSQLDAAQALIDELQTRLDDSEEIKRLAREVSEENDELKYAVGQVDRLQGLLDIREGSQAALNDELLQLESDNEALGTELQRREVVIGSHADELAQLRSDISTAHIVIAFQDAHYEDILLRLKGCGDLQDDRVEEAIIDLKTRVEQALTADHADKIASDRQDAIERLRTQLEVAHEAAAAEQDRYNGVLEALEARTTTHDTRVEAIITSLQAGSEAQDRVVDLERDVAILQDKLSTARFSRDDLTIRLEAVESKVHDSRIGLGSAEVRAAELANDLAVTRAELKESVDREDEPKRKVERLEEALDREIDVATWERQQSAVIAQEAAAELEAAVHAKAEADGTCSELRRQLMDVEEGVTTLRQDLDDAQNELHDARNDNIALMESALELEQAQEKLSRLANVDKDLEETAKGLAQAQQEIARLEEKCATLEKPEGDYEHQALVSSLNGEVQGLQSQVAVLRSQKGTLVEELDVAKDALAIKSEQLAVHRETAVELERAVADAEEAVVQSHEDAERQQANARRQIQRLETSMEDLQMEKTAQADALAVAIKSTSAERMQLVEVNSHCQAYKEQVERIYADEGRRRDEVAQLRRESADAEMRIAGLEKQVERLKEDKEVLDVALDSKQQELEMIKRRYAVKPLTTPARSLSKTVPTTISTPRYITPEETPVPSRRLTLSSSTSAPRRQPLASSTKSNMSPPVFKSKRKSPARRMSLANSTGKPRPSFQRERSLVVEESTEDEGGA